MGFRPELLKIVKQAQAPKPVRTPAPKAKPAPPNMGQSESSRYPDDVALAIEFGRMKHPHFSDKHAYIAATGNLPSNPSLLEQSLAKNAYNVEFQEWLDTRIFPDTKPAEQLQTQAEDAESQNRYEDAVLTNQLENQSDAFFRSDYPGTWAGGAAYNVDKALSGRMQPRIPNWLNESFGPKGNRLRRERREEQKRESLQKQLDALGGE